MAKRETADKALRKMVANKSADIQRTSIIERRIALPQPDFSAYRKKNSYPGEGFFFVGHSYNVENTDGNFTSQRKQAIKQLLKKANKNNTLPVKEALQQKEFVLILSRVERDWLGRLPEGALIGPAIEKDGSEIAECFTVWRKEQRKLTTTQANGKKPAVKTGAKTVAKSASKPAPTTTAKPAGKVKAKAKPVRKVAAKPAAKTTAKPAANASSKTSKTSKPAAKAKTKAVATKSKAKSGRK